MFSNRPIGLCVTFADPMSRKRLKTFTIFNRCRIAKSRLFRQWFSLRANHAFVCVCVPCALCPCLMPVYLLHLADAKQQAQHTLCPYIHNQIWARARSHAQTKPKSNNYKTQPTDRQTDDRPSVRPNETETKAKSIRQQLKQQQQKQSNSTIYTSLNKTLQAIRSASSTPAESRA